MKNIHVLPTPKASRLRTTSKGKLILSSIPFGSRDENKEIYITSDKEIKKGDYVTNGKYVSQAVNEWWTKFYVGNPELKADYWKITLTTDLDLIKDGVQAIPDEFLEWFIKNPSCEGVDTKLIFDEEWNDISDEPFEISYYKIIFPKEEQTDWKNSTKALMEAYGDTLKDFPYEQSTKDRILSETPDKVKERVRFEADALVRKKHLTDIIKDDEELNLYQDTPEKEVLEKIKFVLACNNEAQALRIIEQYGEWKQIGAYSKEEVINILVEFSADIKKVWNITEWFNQFKK